MILRRWRAVLRVVRLLLMLVVVVVAAFMHVWGLLVLEVRLMMLRRSDIGSVAGWLATHIIVRL